MSASAKKRRRTSVYVSVQVDLDEIDTEDLIEELAQRGITTITELPDNPWMQAYEALRFERDPLPKLKALVMDATGRILT